MDKDNESKGPVGYVFMYNGEIVEGYYNLAKKLGSTFSIVQYWVKKTAKEDHFKFREMRIDILRKGTFVTGKQKPKYYNKNKQIENFVRINGEHEYSYSGVTGKLIGTRNIKNK